MKQTLILVSCLLVMGCSQAPTAPSPFQGERSYSYIADQLAFGPRVPGSEAWKECRGYFYRHFQNCELAVDSQVFGFHDPYSKQDYPLVNVIGRYRGGDDDDPALLLVAHWDTRPRTDFHSDTNRINEPIQGANDGASGVAVLMELANLLHEDRPTVNVDLVLVDGEDWGKPGDSQYYLMGSREFARSKIRDRYQCGIVVDMIGDLDQQIYREQYSERFRKPLNDVIWSLAASLGVTTFIDSSKYTILDDHLEINTGGVPCIVLIDFDYPYWHTENDTADKCSPAALENVGTVLSHFVYDRTLWPYQK